MSAVRLLLVEGDQPTGQLLAEHLEADGYEVHATATMEAASREIAAEWPDLMLLDLSMPRGVAPALLAEVAVDCPEIGVIVMSGRDTERERVSALKLGAADYVAKPFAYSELLARVNALVRRQRAVDRVATVGEIEINRAERSVKVAGRVVQLSAKEFGVVSLLATDPVKVFSKEEILREVWGYRSLGHTRTLEAHASRVRRKLDPHNGRYIVNCWGVGYALLRSEDAPRETKAETTAELDIDAEEKDREPFTVIGTFRDTDDQPFASTYGAPSPEDAIRQAHEDSAGDLVVAGVLRGVVEVIA